MNEFQYIVGASPSLSSGLRTWRFKYQEYVNLYYQGDRENARGTEFYSCMAKIDVLNNALDEGEDINAFRSVLDNSGLLQAAAIITIDEVEFELEFLPCIIIDSLTNSPWNVIEQVQPETRKGAASSLIEKLVLESQEQGFGGMIKTFTIPRAREFYKNIGFIETDGSREMILTDQAAQAFLLDQGQRRLSNPFD